MTRTSKVPSTMAKVYIESAAASDGIILGM